MPKKNYFKRYRLIIQRLQTKPSTFEEIRNYINNHTLGEEMLYSKRTFIRDKEDIEDLFQIKIVYSNSERVYKLEKSDFIYENDVLNELLDAHNLYESLQLTKNASNILITEPRLSKGTKFLSGFIYGITNNLVVQFNYQKHWENFKTERSLEPYALKQFNHIWYVLGRDTKDKKMKTFGLDRITDLELTTIHFKIKKPFQPSELFKYRFGIMPPEKESDKPQNIVLKFTKIQGKYILGNPLHHTQKIVKQTDTHITISLKLYITYDFIMKLLSYGCEVKVLEPTILSERVKEQYIKALKNY